MVVLLLFWDLLKESWLLTLTGKNIIHMVVFLFFRKVIPKLAFLFESYNIPGKKFKSSQFSKVKIISIAHGLLVEVFCRNICMVQEGRREVVGYRLFTVTTAPVGVETVHR